ncbi:DUF6207 family protein [Streptomyces sp. NPDC029674]|uniref:DUF6207 family protein n=1 Tax=Streptomyces sp. NPDC029674 TaxID=3365297 RepID=UPI00384EA144
MTSRPAHLSVPGLAQIIVESADAETALAVAYRLIARHNLTGPSDLYRVPGEDGVRVRMYGDAVPLVHEEHGEL